AAVEAQELAGGELLVDEGAIRDEAQRGLGHLGLPRQVVAVDDDASRGRLEQTRDDADGRRLARAVGTQETVDLAVADGQAHVVDGREGPVLLDQALHLDHGRSFKKAATSSVRRSRPAGGGRTPWGAGPGSDG